MLVPWKDYDGKHNEDNNYVQCAYCDKEANHKISYEACPDCKGAKCGKYGLAVSLCADCYEEEKAYV